MLLAAPLFAQQQRVQILSRLTWFDRAGNRLGGIGPVPITAIEIQSITVL